MMSTDASLKIRGMESTDSVVVIHARACRAEDCRQKLRSDDVQSVRSIQPVKPASQRSGGVVQCGTFLLLHRFVIVDDTDIIFEHTLNELDSMNGVRGNRDGKQ